MSSPLQFYKNLLRSHFPPAQRDCWNTGISHRTEIPGCPIYPFLFTSEGWTAVPSGLWRWPTERCVDAGDAQRRRLRILLCFPSDICLPWQRAVPRPLLPAVRLQGPPCCRAAILYHCCGGLKPFALCLHVKSLPWTLFKWLRAEVTALCRSQQAAVLGL